MKKNIIILAPNDIDYCYSPLLWASSKSFYELNGTRVNDYNWVLPIGDFLYSVDEITKWIADNPPDVLGISLYVWNFNKVMTVAKWVREHYPNCLIISGGPQQYFKYDDDWFKKYPFIDGSLPGEEYGENCIADLLDNLNDDNTVNWNNVTGVVYPSKNRSMMMTSNRRIYKKDLKWDYAPYAMQFDLVEAWFKQALIYKHETPHLQWDYPAAKAETTRGCPYGCTFCDWGGGINSKVIKRSLESVRDDAKALADLKFALIYLCDANFGIFKDRDVEVTKIWAEIKKQTGFPKVFHIGGGYAKTKHAKEAIRSILTIIAENELDYIQSYKVPIQTFNDQILANIDRVNPPLEMHQELSAYMRENYGFRPHAEMIMGLPGQTVDNWYWELEQLAENDFAPQIYPWVLLPEAPGSNPEYIKKYDIKFALKRSVTGTTVLHRVDSMLEDFFGDKFTDFCFVCETNSYTKKDFAQMAVMGGFYIGIYYTGIIRETMKLLKPRGLKLSKFLSLMWKHIEEQQCDASRYMYKVYTGYLEWLDTEVGSLFYTKSMYENDTLMYDVDELLLSAIFWYPTEFNMFFNKVFNDMDQSLNANEMFKNMISHVSYKDWDVNKIWEKHKKLEPLEAFHAALSAIHPLSRPDVFLLKRGLAQGGFYYDGGKAK